jgi:alpha-mannosidase
VASQGSNGLGAVVLIVVLAGAAGLARAALPPAVAPTPLASPVSLASPAPPAAPPFAPPAPPVPSHASAAQLADPRGTLYAIATAHLDTQWRWTIRETIEKHIPLTLRTNLDFFDRYPGYTFSFEGAFRYQLAREYYPREWERMRQAIAAGRWRVTGSWVDAVDTNIPSPESLTRHVLYGNGYFRREFGCESADVFLPDCFGFGATLPAVAAHCGLLGFSSQKLTWGSAAGVPFDLGLWEGIDGSTLVSALNPGAYVGTIDGDLSSDSTAIATVAKQGAASGTHAGVRYFGTGDTGGGPTEASVQWLERSLGGAGPVRVLSAPGDQFARDLSTPEAAGLRARLVRYRGELLMTRHGTGCYTSEAAMKRMNRRNESLSDAAERASLAAYLLGACPYPREAMRENQVRFLWHQFHDDLTGTSIPEAYAFSWNDERISENRFAAMLGDAVGGVARSLDTRAWGIPVVVYNPLSIARADVVEITIPESGTGLGGGSRADAATGGRAAPGASARMGYRWARSAVTDRAGRPGVQVIGPCGHEVPAQVLGISDAGLRVAFLAHVPATGFAVFDVRVGGDAGEWREQDAGGVRERDTGPRTLAVGPSFLENERYRVRLDAEGDIASIVDRASGGELLRAPLRLQLIDDEPTNWPAWEIDYEDLMAPPRSVVRGPAAVRIAEDGPARVALEVTRQAEGSTFVQRIRLATGGASDRLEVETLVDWRTPGTLLKAAFPFTLASEQASYDLGVGVLRRGVNTEKLYEVPAQKWAALSSADGSGTVAVLNDCRYGWDHPDSATLRLSLVHTPRVNAGWTWVADEGTQDLGRHQVTYAICSIPASGGTAEISWQAERLNRPLVAVVAPKHHGPLGRQFSLLQVEGAEAVIVRACKLAEEENAVIVRLQELDGANATARLRFPWPVRSVREVTGAETPFDPALASLSPTRSTAPPVVEPIGGMVRVGFGPWQLRTLRLELATPTPDLARPVTAACDLPFNFRGITVDGETGGAFDAVGGSIPSEILPTIVETEGIAFRTGPRVPGMPNVLACRGQRLKLPGGRWNRLYLLAAAVGGDRRASFLVGGRPREAWVQDWAEPVGSWDDRLADGKLAQDPARITPAFVKPARLGWVGTHRHDAAGANVSYAITPICRLRLDLAPGERAVTLPEDPGIRILAATAAFNENDLATLATPVIDEAPVTAVRIETPTSGFLESTEVRLSTPDPEAAVHFTLDGSEPGAGSPAYVAPLRIDRDCTLRARALHPGRDDRFVAVREFRRLTPRPAISVAGELQPGLAFRVYHGDWNQLPDFASLPAAASGVISSVRLPAEVPEDLFGVRLEGYLRVPADGVYLFSLRSDDGSRLYIDGALAVDSDGLHGLGDDRGEIPLAAGLHRLRVDQFEQGGDQDLELWIAGPGLALQPVPGSMLVRDEDGI